MRMLATLRSLVLGIWIGAMLCAGAITAPAVFAKIESRSLAGEVFGSILQRLNKFEFICLVMLGLLRVAFLIRKKKSTLKTLNGNRSPENIWPDKNLTNENKLVKKLLPSDCVLLIIIGFWFYYAQIITPEMTKLKKVIPSFDVKITELEGDPKKLSELEARLRFDFLHARYSQMMKGNMVLGVILFFIP